MTDLSMNDSLMLPPFDPKDEVHFDLGATAYDNVHAPVFHAWLKLDRQKQQKALQDRYIFYACAVCVGGHVVDLLKQDFEKANIFIARWMGDIAWLSQSGTSLSEEWFNGLDRLAGDLSNLHFISESRTIIALGVKTGVKKFPRIAQSLQIQAAYLDALTGKREKGAEIALRLVRRPYLLPGRRELPALCHRLMHILAAANHLHEYRLVLWTGISFPFMTGGLRDAFSEQIVKTYRGAWRAVINLDVPFRYLFPFLLANLAHLVSSVSLLRKIGLDKPIRLLHTGLLYVLDRYLFKKNELFREANLRHSNAGTVTGNAEVSKSWQWPKLRIKTKRILVTRAMGGIGDILMMTPGLMALRRKYPKAQIDFAVPRSFHPVLEGLPGIRLLDIDGDLIDLARYRRWINLTDCPAGRVESRQYPNVRRNRIEIFAKAMGISKWRLRFGVGFTPWYRVTEDERQWADERMKVLNPEGLPVIGIQPFAADSYRNWPYMERLVAHLAKDNFVLLFHNEDILGFDFDHVVKIKESIRNSVSLVSQCDQLIVPDSSFLHVAAALKIPTVAIFGAISGRLRTRRYPLVKLLAPNKKEFPCYPCWRHEFKPCHLTNRRESICLRSITVENVLQALSLEWQPKRVTLFKRMFDWIRYGGE